MAFGARSSTESSRWGEKEDAAIVALKAQGKNSEEIAAIIGRSASGIRARINNVGIAALADDGNEEEDIHQDNVERDTAFRRAVVAAIMQGCEAPPISPAALIGLQLPPLPAAPAPSLVPPSPEIDLMAACAEKFRITPDQLSAAISFATRPSRHDFDEIKVEICRQFGIARRDLESNRRSACYPRQLAMGLGRRLTSLSFPQIAKELGGLDHSTVIYGVQKFEPVLTEAAARLPENADVASWVAITREIMERTRKAEKTS